MAGIGDRAPDFELKDENDKPVSLRDYNGRKVLIAFFPFAFSPVCTDEFSCFQDDLERFAKEGVQILGISVDSHWSNKAFKDSLGISFPLLSDFNKEVSRKFGVLRKEGFSERAYFLVDESGFVRFKHIMDVPGKRLDNEELLAAINQHAESK
ncbi:MAG: redoxin domain-containing protein [Candidatus Aenigmarchaeota archaeon]|nr:redoxin domain-containing protein [Candidatus Aenigmarchaeota archaeon]